jgi:hypothetical protein
MRRAFATDQTGRIRLTRELQLSAQLSASPAHRVVLRPIGKASDAAAAVRAERETQAGKRAKDKT